MKALFVLHAPPPVHGAALVGEAIRRSAAVRGAVDARFVRLRASTHVGEVGRPGLRKVGALAAVAAEVAAERARFRPDVVYYTAAPCGWAFYRDMALLPLLAASGARLLLHYHMLGAAAFARRDPVARALYRRLLPRAELLLLSPGHAADFAGLGRPRAVHVVPNGIDDPLHGTFETRPRSGPPNVLFLSNMAADKGWRAVLDLAARFPGRARFHFAGAWLDPADERELAARGLPVTHHGFVEGARKDALYRAADLFVLPTRRDAFPLVLAEALAYGVPVLTTDVGLIRENLDPECGAVVPPDDPEALATAFARLCRPLDEATARRCRAAWEARFTRARFERALLRALGPGGAGEGARAPCPATCPAG